MGLDNVWHRQVLRLQCGGRFGQTLGNRQWQRALGAHSHVGFIYPLNHSIRLPSPTAHAITTNIIQGDRSSGLQASNIVLNKVAGVGPVGWGWKLLPLSYKVCIV